MPDKNIIQIRFNKSKSMPLMLFGALTFVAVSIFLLLLPSVLHKVVGIIGIIFFGFCALAIFLMLFKKGYALELTPLGIQDNSSAISAGYIPWSEVTGIRESVMSGQVFITVDVLNPGEHSNRGNLLQSWVKKANIGLVGSPVNISAQAMKITHNELLDLLIKHAKRYAGN